MNKLTAREASAAHAFTTTQDPTQRAALVELSLGNLTSRYADDQSMLDALTPAVGTREGALRVAVACYVCHGGAPPRGGAEPAPSPPVRRAAVRGEVLPC